MKLKLDENLGRRGIDILTESIAGKLWMVEIGRIRIYRPEE